MDELNFIKGKLDNGKIITELSADEIAKMVSNKRVVIIKDLFSPNELQSLIKAAVAWGKETAPVTQDDFKGNYHSMKAKVSNIQQVPHVFHDYNFNDFTILPEDFKNRMFGVFEPLRIFYNSLTGYQKPFGFIQNEPYLHPQLIHYPLGGGFFGRHNHNLLPQKVGFILSLSHYGIDYKNGGTCFVIDDEVVDIEGKLDIGDLCLWPNDVDHWVKQSALEDQFDWHSDKGRWVATLANFNPYT
jgi:hypothetical protein